MALSFLGWLLIACAAVAIVGYVEAGAFEDDGWRGEYPSHVMMSSWTLRSISVINILKAFKAEAAIEALVFINGHRDDSSNLVCKAGE